MITRFNFYGVSLEIFCGSAHFTSVIEDLKNDFGFFLHAQENSPLCRLQFFLIPSSRLSKVRLRLPYFFKTRMCQVYGLGPVRACRYAQDLWVISKNHRALRKFYVIGTDHDSVYEVLYTAILSAVGEELDALGYHRLHALGFSVGGQNVLLPLASGGGKSSLAALLLRDERYQIFSDEIPLIKGGKVFPFPIRMALLPAVSHALGLDTSTARVFRRRIFKEKFLFDIPQAKVARSGAVEFLFYDQSRVFFRVVFIWNLVWGLGVPQMAEHMLRAENFFRLLKIALSRLRNAVLFFKNVQFQAMSVSPKPEANKAFVDKYF